MGGGDGICIRTVFISRAESVTGNVRCSLKLFGLLRGKDEKGAFLPKAPEVGGGGDEGYNLGFLASL